jgi:hypothetical protein
MSSEYGYISGPDEESSVNSFFDYSESDDDNNNEIKYNYEATTMYLVFIFNRRKVVWHEANSNYTVADVFKDLENIYNVKKCMLDIEQHTFFKPNNLLLQPLMRNRAGCDIHVSMKDRLVDRCVQNNTHRVQSSELG